jgi:excisionase family DNA binding protein
MSLYRELPPDADLGLTVRQAALLIGCSESRVRKLLRRKNGGLRGYKDGRSVRIYLSSVDEYRSARAAPAPCMSGRAPPSPDFAPLAYGSSAGGVSHGGLVQ